MGIEKGSGTGRGRRKDTVTFELPPKLPNDIEPSTSIAAAVAGQSEAVPGVAAEAQQEPTAAEASTEVHASAPQEPATKRDEATTVTPAATLSAPGNGGEERAPDAPKKTSKARSKSVYKKVLYYAPRRELSEFAKGKTQKRHREPVSSSESDSESSDSDESDTESEEGEIVAVTRARPSKSRATVRRDDKATRKTETKPVLKKRAPEPVVDEDSQSDTDTDDEIFQKISRPESKYFFI